MEKSKHALPRTDGGWAARKGGGTSPHDKAVVNHRESGKHEMRQKKPTMRTR